MGAATAMELVVSWGRVTEQWANGHHLPLAELMSSSSPPLLLHPANKTFVTAQKPPHSSPFLVCVFQMSLNPSWKGYLATTSWPLGASTSTGGTTGTCRTATSCCRARWKRSARRSSAPPANSLASVSGVGTTQTTSCLGKGTSTLPQAWGSWAQGLVELGLGLGLIPDVGGVGVDVWGKR